MRGRGGKGKKNKGGETRLKENEMSDNKGRGV